MKIERIEIHYSRTHSLGNYSNVKPGVTLGAALEDGDDPDAVRAQLLAEAKAIVEEQIDQALEAEDEPAKFSAERRYKVLSTSDYFPDGLWGRRDERRVSPPEQLVVVLPQDITIDRGGAACWYQEVYGAKKLRFHHAIDKAHAWLGSHDGYRLIVCALDDLSAIPAWFFEAPQALVVEPDQQAEAEAPIPVPDLDDAGDEYDEDDDEEDA